MSFHSSGWKCKNYSVICYASQLVEYLHGKSISVRPVNGPCVLDLFAWLPSFTCRSRYVVVLSLRFTGAFAYH